MMLELTPSPASDLDAESRQWQPMTLDKVAHFVNGYGFEPTEWKTEGRPIIRIQNLTGSSNKLNYFDGELPAKYLIHKGDLLISWSASLDAFIWDGEEAWLNQHIFKVSNIAPTIDKMFLYFTLRHHIDVIRRKTHGSTMKHVPRKTFLDTTVLVPPLPEQLAISKLLMTLREVIATRYEELTLERERKAALMQHLFSHGIYDEPHKQTDVGEVPQSWRVVPLSAVLREPLKNGFSGRETDAPHAVRTLTLSAVTKNDFSVKNTKMTDADPQKVLGLWLVPGDIFVERGNTLEFVGLASLYEGPKNFAIYPDLLIRVRANAEEIDSRFLAEYLRSSDECRSYFRRNATGTAGSMPKIDHRTLSEIRIPVPNLSEQQAIVAALRAVDSKIFVLDNEVTLLDELFRTLLEELMTGRRSALPIIEAEQLV